MANTVTAILQTLWSDIVMPLLHEKAQAHQFCNVDYDGDCKLGQTVKVASPQAGTVGTYTPGTDINLADQTPTVVDIIVNQYKYFAFNDDDVQSLFTRPKLLAMTLDENIQGLAEAADTAVWANAYANAGADIDASDAPTPGADNAGIILDRTVQSATASHMSVAEILAVARRKMDQAKVPAAGRIAVLDPRCFEFLTPVSQSQLITDYKFGFEVLAQSALLTKAASIRHALAFHRSAISFPMAMQTVESARLPMQFGSVVKGLMVYGIKALATGRIWDIKIAEA